MPVNLKDVTKYALYPSRVYVRLADTWLRSLLEPSIVGILHSLRGARR